MPPQPRSPQSSTEDKHKQFPWIIVILVSGVVIIILAFILVTFLILRIKGEDRGINTLIIVYTVAGFVVSILSLLFGFLQWYQPKTQENKVATIQAASLGQLELDKREEHQAETRELSLNKFPYQRNPFFTGREALLKHLHEMFKSGVATTNFPLAISGLGGIGKTQIAIEYAYRYSDEYKKVLWAKADTPENLRSDFIKIAGLLDLPEKDNKDSQRAVDAVKDWLKNHSSWLLIFDNVDKPEVVLDFLPLPSQGHILLTTRVMALSRIAKRVEIDTMEIGEGARFLLHRAGIREPIATTDQNYAREIVQKVGGLPLAIDQVGAYIERTQEGLSLYLKLYQAHGAELRREDKDKPPDYNYTVATTWSLSFQKVEQANPATIELLRLCAFLDPDTIPEEIVIGGTQALGPILGPIASDPFRMNEAVGELLSFSLIRRNSEMRTLTIHRLVQEVIQDNMDEETQSAWAERAIRVVNHAFPDKINVNDVETWKRCEPYLPHARACAALIKKYGLASSEAARLLNQAGYYLREQARFKEAEPLFQQALAIREQISGPEHIDTAKSLNNLAQFYFDQYMYAKAEPLYKRALAIRERILGPDHEDTIRNLNRLALNYWYMGNKSKKDEELEYEKADQLYRRALPLSEQLLGPEEPTLTLHIRNNMALLYRSQGKYEDAIKINEQVLTIRKRILGQEHLDVAQSLQNLAVTYYEQRNKSKYEEAEGLLREALAIREKKYREKHPQIARCLRYLALICVVQRKYEQAEQYFKRALKIYEELPEVDRSQAIEIKREYAVLLRKMKHNKEADMIEAEINTIQDTRSLQD